MKIHTYDLIDVLWKQKYNREMELMFSEEEDIKNMTSRKQSSSGNSTPRSRRPSFSRENSSNPPSGANSPSKPSKKQMMSRLSPKGTSKTSAYTFEAF